MSSHLVRRDAHPGVLTRKVVGTPAEVAATVALVRDSGRLLAMTRPQQVPGDSSRVWVAVRFLDRLQPAPVPARRARRWPLVLAIAVPMLTVAALVGYLVTQLVQTAMASGPLILGALAALALAVLILRPHRATCPGLHCSGCKH